MRKFFEITKTGMSINIGRLLVCFCRGLNGWSFGIHWLIDYSKYEERK